MQTKTIFLIILSAGLAISLAFNVWLGYRCIAWDQIYKQTRLESKTLSFTEMFVKNVLMASKEIDFDTRLELETAVRSLEDKEIFSQWQNFTKAETKESASLEAKLLLKLLIEKIKGPQ